MIAKALFFCVSKPSPKNLASAQDWVLELIFFFADTS